MDEEVSYQKDVRSYALNVMGLAPEKIDRMRFTDLDIQVRKHIDEHHAIESVIHNHKDVLGATEIKTMNQDTNELLGGILNDDSLGIASYDEVNKKYKIDLALNSDIEKICLDDNEVKLKNFADQVTSVFDIIVSIKEKIVKDEEIFKIEGYLSEKERGELKNVHIHQKRIIKYLYKLLLYIHQALNSLHEKRTRIETLIVPNAENKETCQLIRIKNKKISALNTLIEWKLQELRK